jgi:hypothetical protein
MTSGDTDRPTISRLVGVYNADGTFLGEAAYWIGARFGRTHCALCDIRHGLLRERDDWKACKIGLPVTFDCYHRNDQPSAVRAVSNDTSPVVVAETDLGLFLLLSPYELTACAGSPDALLLSIESAVHRAGLQWPMEPHRLA